MEKQKTGKGLTVIAKMRLELFYAHQYNYHKLMRERVDTFDEDGTTEITKEDGTKYRQGGRKFITDTIRYFEKKDDAHYYRMCAKLKKVLDEYDEKFKDVI